jgi:hypothetical protein
MVSRASNTASSTTVLPPAGDRADRRAEVGERRVHVDTSRPPGEKVAEDAADVLIREVVRPREAPLDLSEPTLPAI